MTILYLAYNELGHGPEYLDRSQAIDRFGSDAVTRAEGQVTRPDAVGWAGKLRVSAHE